MAKLKFEFTTDENATLVWDFEGVVTKEVIESLSSVLNLVPVTKPKIRLLSIGGLKSDLNIVPPIKNIREVFKLPLKEAKDIFDRAQVNDVVVQTPLPDPHIPSFDDAEIIRRFQQFFDRVSIV